MRITRETLLRLARETAAERVRVNRDILSAYVYGSLLGDDPLLGGTTDIDLVLIHSGEPVVEQEIVRLSADVHVDLRHHHQRQYHQPRHLRQDPWLGPVLAENVLLLHDTQHWFEFIQAGVRSQFWQADNVLSRARPLAEQARQGWLGLQGSPEHGAAALFRFLRTLELAANSIALLSGAALPERRFFQAYRARAAAAGQPDLPEGLAAILGAANAPGEQILGWLPAWQADVEAAGAAENPRLSAHRVPYYRRVIEALAGGERPADALWPLLTTWAAAWEGGEPSEPGATALSGLGFDGAGWEQRLNALDSYLDRVEETLDQWAAANGV